MLRIISIFSLCLFSLSAFAADKKPAPPVPAKEKSAPKEKSSVTSTIVFENKMVNGAKTWLPASTTVKEGHMIVAKLVNTLPEPHGFEIPGVIKVEVMANETKVVTLEGLKKGQTYEIKCHLHPKHVGAKLVVE